eukprot:sb/3468113/
MMTSNNLMLASQVSMASNTSLDSITSGRSDQEVLAVGQGGNQFEVLVREALDFTEMSMEKEEQFVENFFRETKSPRERRDLVEMILCRFGSQWDDFVHTSCKFDIYYSLPIFLSLLDKLDNLSRESFAFAVFRKNLNVANEYFNKMYKLPVEVVIVENYHFIYTFLLKNKIDSLDKYRSFCHKRYKDSLEEYVKAYLTLPLERINVFFCGVQNKLDSGVRVTEIGFDPEFSKQKLKALIGEYSVKELKKGVEAVMKKIEKHFSKDKNLFMVS